MLGIIPAKELDAMDHSPLGPSSAGRWLNCTGSVLWTWDMEEKPSEFAAEGTFGHNISEYCRVEKRPARDFIGHTETIDGFTFTCDAAFADAVQKFVDYVSQFKGKAFFEVRLSYDEWVKYGFGTTDDLRIQTLVCGRHKLIVTDLKMGVGIQCYAEQNEQLKLYALAAIQEFGMIYDFAEIQLNICQPRLGHIDEWETTYEELIKFGEFAGKRGEEALSGEGVFVPGPWCDKHFCKGRTICKARAEHVAEILDAEMDEECDIETPLKDTNELTSSMIGKIYGKLDLIIKFCGSIKTRAEELVASGEKVIGPDGLPLKMVAGRSDRAWKDKDEAAKKIKNTRKVPIDVLYEKKLAGIPKVEKLLGSNHPFFDLDNKKCLIKKPPGKPTLVLGSDRREALPSVEDEMDDIDDGAEMDDDDMDFLL